MTKEQINEILLTGFTQQEIDEMDEEMRYDVAQDIQEEIETGEREVHVLSMLGHYG